MNFLNIKKKKIDFLKRENFYYLLIIFSIFFLDNYSKQYVIGNFNENIYFINGYLNINLIRNTGIGFGLLSSNSSIIYNLITALIAIIIFVLLYTGINFHKVDKLIFSIIIGGAVGNLYDRLVYNAVPDFIDLHYNNFHWFTFNVADVFITLGIIFFIIRGFFEKN